jgi:hypothetical protein
MNRRRADFDRTAPEDPARAAQIILDIVISTNRHCACSSGRTR